MVDSKLLDLEIRFERIKERVNRGLPYVMAITEVDQVLSLAYGYSAFWMSINIDKAYLKRLNALIKQLNQFKRDLKDLLEFQKGITL